MEVRYICSVKFCILDASVFTVSVIKKGLYLYLRYGVQATLYVLVIDLSHARHSF